MRSQGTAAKAIPPPPSIHDPTTAAKLHPVTTRTAAPRNTEDVTSMAGDGGSPAEPAPAVARASGRRSGREPCKAPAYVRTASARVRRPLRGAPYSVCVNKCAATQARPSLPALWHGKLVAVLALAITATTAGCLALVALDLGDRPVLQPGILTLTGSAEAFNWGAVLES